MSKDTGKSLRFAALIRVSTEQQEKQGESLRVQRDQNEKNITLLEGDISGWYGGQEHATPGWEKKEVDRLIADAAKQKFDAVIVATADRWSRDNVKSTEGLEVFKRHGIRFFAGVTEYDLRNPEHTLFLDLSSAIGKFQASNQTKKAMLSKIARAKRGLPPNGSRPFGRIFTWSDNRHQDGKWSIDPQQQAIIQDVAERYLAGGSLPKLAAEYGMWAGTLNNALREQCGSDWVIAFDPGFGIEAESVTIRVPPLLPEPMIEQVRQRLRANRNWLHKPPRSVHDYLLSGRVFCEACGNSLCGKHLNGRLYYAHSFAERLQDCPVRPRPHVPARRLEQQVIQQLFQMLGSPEAIRKAVKSAVPDCDKILDRKQRLQGEMGKIDKARGRLLDLVERDALTVDQAQQKLAELGRKQADFRDELRKVEERLAALPDQQQLQCYVEQLGSGIYVMDDNGDRYLGGNDIQTYLSMSREDHRRLIQSAFGGPLEDGSPSGIYVASVAGRPHRPKQWTVTIRGRLDFQLVMRNSGC